VVLGGLRIEEKPAAQEVQKEVPHEELQALRRLLDVAARVPTGPMEVAAALLIVVSQLTLQLGLGLADQWRQNTAASTPELVAAVRTLPANWEQQAVGRHEEHGETVDSHRVEVERRETPKPWLLQVTYSQYVTPDSTQCALRRCPAKGHLQTR
jgi:hypothetical protein